MEFGIPFRWKPTSSAFFPNYDAKTLYERQWTLATNCNMAINDWEPSHRFLYMYSLYEEDRKKKEKAREEANAAAMNRQARAAQVFRNNRNRKR